MVQGGPKRKQECQEEEGLANKGWCSVEVRMGVERHRWNVTIKQQDWRPCYCSSKIRYMPGTQAMSGV